MRTVFALVFVSCFGAMSVALCDSPTPSPTKDESSLRSLIMKPDGASLREKLGVSGMPPGEAPGAHPQQGPTYDDLIAIIQKQDALIKALQARVQELEGSPKGPPASAKP